MAATEQHPDPDWLDRDRYPFDSHFMELDPGRMHYVDEGDGRPLLMLHGNPSWSFSFRHLIGGLADEYRCIAPDHLGFGLSDKPVGWSYRPEDHARNITVLIDELGLSDITLIGIDWGGPIGLNYATNDPDNMHSIVLMNTMMWPTEQLKGRLFSAVLGSRLSRFLIRRYNLFASRIMKVLMGDKSNLTPEVHEHYTAPLATPDDREASWVFPREVTDSNEWLADLWDRRTQLADIPMLLAWGTEDPALGPAVSRWQETFPHAQALEFSEIGHFVPEELGPELVAPIEEFLESA